MLLRSVPVFVLAACAVAQQPEASPAEAALRIGLTTFRHGVYSEAANHFEQAYRLDPSLEDARVYYGYAEMMQYIPGETSPQNLRHADIALDVFREAAGWEPPHEMALNLLASLAFNMERLDDASDAHRRLLEADPTIVESHYTLGVIAWKRSIEPRMKLREELGMAPTEGPIVDAERRIRFAIVMRPTIDEGLAHLEKALELNPEYADAMAYANLLERELADLSETEEEYRGHMAKADEWVRKTLAMKKTLAQQAATEAQR